MSLVEIILAIAILALSAIVLLGTIENLRNYRDEREGSR